MFSLTDAISLKWRLTSVEPWAVISFLFLSVIQPAWGIEGEAKLDKGRILVEEWPNPIPDRLLHLKYQEAEALMRQQKWAETQKVLEALIEERPSDVSLHVNYARVLFMQRKREAALIYLTRAYNQFKSKAAQITIREHHEVLSKAFYTQNVSQTYQEGLELLNERDFEKAEETLLRAYRDEPKNLLVLVRLAQARVMNNSSTSALSLLKEASQLNPYNRESKLWLGRAYQMRGLNVEALQTLEGLYRVDSRDERVTYWYASVLLSLGRQKDAEKIFKKEMRRKQPLVALGWAVTFLQNRSGKEMTVLNDRLGELISDYSKYESARKKDLVAELRFHPYTPEELLNRLKSLKKTVNSRAQSQI